MKGLFEGATEAIGNSMFWNTVHATYSRYILPQHQPAVGNWFRRLGGGGMGLFFRRSAHQPRRKQTNCLGDSSNLDGANGKRFGAEYGFRFRNYPRTFATARGRVHDMEGLSTDARPPLLEWAYPRLKKWHEWWLGDRGDGQSWRDGNHDGLLEWGSDRGSAPGPGGRGYLMASRWETAIDNNPMYDEVKYNPKTYTMDLDNVGLNSLYALDGECLAQIATILGKEEDAKAFTADYERQKQRMREKLWNEQDGIFENRFWSGEFSKHLSPTNFYPLLAGIPTPQQAKRMIDGHLLNPKEFWGPYILPSISRNDPAFVDQFYVRGTIWGPLNYLVYQGVNRYRFDDVALQFAQKSYDLYMDDWRGAQHDDEQYGAAGGNGGGDPHYTWGALLPEIALDQYADVNPWEACASEH